MLLSSTIICSSHSQSQKTQSPILSILAGSVILLRQPQFLNDSEGSCFKPVTFDKSRLNFFPLFSEKNYNECRILPNALSSISPVSSTVPPFFTESHITLSKLSTVAVTIDSLTEIPVQKNKNKRQPAHSAKIFKNFFITPSLFSYAPILAYVRKICKYHQQNRHHDDCYFCHFLESSS